MSALLERNHTSISTSNQASRGLELRKIPYLFETNSSDTVGYTKSEFASDLYTKLSKNWLYSATLQLTMNGSQPPWSRDGWSFTPIDLAQFSNGSQYMDPSSSDLVVNVSITTPAIRARLECSPYEDLGNTSAWLTLRDLRNTSYWNASTIPHAIKSAYQPGYRKDGKLLPHFFNTSYLTDGTVITCCSNGSSWPPPPSALGRWTVSGNPDAELQPHFNLTIKWIYGPLISGLMLNSVVNATAAEFAMFPEIPLVQALDCIPIIETSSAWVKVDQRSGRVMDFSILDEPKEASEAWAHNFVEHFNKSRGTLLPTHESTTTIIATRTVTRYSPAAREAGGLLTQGTLFPKETKERRHEKQNDYDTYDLDGVNLNRTVR